MEAVVNDSFYIQRFPININITDINVDELNEEELKIYKEELKAAETNKQNVWSEIIEICSNGDLTKYDEVLNTNLFLVFSKLTKAKNQSKNQPKK